MDYWNALLDVAQDLLAFLMGEKPSLPERPVVLERTPLLEAPSGLTTALPQRAPGAPALSDVALDVLVSAEHTAPLHAFARGWVGVVRARLFTRPIHAVDTVLRHLSYGTEVQVVRYEGRFAYVQYGEVAGWVLKDELVFEMAALFPLLHSGEQYGAHHPATALIRTYLEDAFATEALLLPLLAVEYVAYTLKRAGREIVWPAERPRPAGLWHHILRGVPGIHIGVTPRTGALMEWQTVDGGGYLAITEAVHPDGVVVVAGVGRQREGEFLRETLTEPEYREKRALWIMVS